jgi:hypothetical protein
MMTACKTQLPVFLIELKDPDFITLSLPKCPRQNPVLFSTHKARKNLNSLMGKTNQR